MATGVLVQALCHRVWLLERLVGHALNMQKPRHSETRESCLDSCVEQAFKAQSWTEQSVKNRFLTRREKSKSG